MPREIKKPVIVIAAGGTGGHVFPGLAVAKLFREKGYEVHWLGTPSGLEAEQVPEAGFIFHPIHVQGLRGKVGWRKLLGLYAVCGALWQSIKVLRRLHPIGVLGMGGFVAGPAGLAAGLLRIPLVIHEQNAVAGMTNRLLSPLAKRILTAFPAAFSSAKTQLVGNPLRAEIIASPPPEQRGLNRRGALRLLILGGSLGAQALNETVPQGLALMPLDQRPEVIHQAGKNHWQATLALYEKLGVSAQVKPFLSHMAEMYQWADLVICRAGALTVGELTAVGVPAVLVPFPFAVDDHQTKNAAFLVQAGAARLVAQADFSAAVLKELLSTELTQRDRLLTMAQAARRLAKPQATEAVANAFLEVCCEKY